MKIYSIIEFNQEEKNFDAIVVIGSYRTRARAEKELVKHCVSFLKEMDGFDDDKEEINDDAVVERMQDMSVIYEIFVSNVNIDLK